MTEGWKQSKQLYVILPDGETAGPHSAEDIEEMLEEETIQEETFAFCEGMRDWRSISEALVWARLDLAKVIWPAIEIEVNRLLNAEINDATARSHLRKAIHEQGIQPSDGEVAAVETILHTNTDLRRKYNNLGQDNSPDVIEFYPAAEIWKLADLKFPRDWNAVWERAGGRVLGGRMIARVDDPVWLKLSDFGYPFSPFSFEPWIDTQSVDRNEAIELGLIQKAEMVQPHQIPEQFVPVGI